MPGGCEHISLHANCPHCLKIQQEYYQKLQQSGYIDIEDTSHPHRPLLCWHSLKWKKLSQRSKEQIETYYQKARDLLHSYPFSNPVQRKIWELHSDGLSKKKIEKELQHSDSPYKRESIGTIIQSIAKEIK